MRVQCSSHCHHTDRALHIQSTTRTEHYTYRTALHRQNSTQIRHYTGRALHRQTSTQTAHFIRRTLHRVLHRHSTIQSEHYTDRALYRQSITQAEHYISIKEYINKTPQDRALHGQSTTPSEHYKEHYTVHIQNITHVCLDMVNEGYHRQNSPLYIFQRTALTGSILMRIFT